MNSSMGINVVINTIFHLYLIIKELLTIILVI